MGMYGKMRENKMAKLMAAARPYIIRDENDEVKKVINNLDSIRIFNYS